MSTNAGGAVQGGGLPPVESEDINGPQETPKATEAQETKTPKAGKEQATESQPTSTDEGAKEKGPGPWDAELQKRGLADPNFDAFLREVVQPYVTQLEQGGGGGEIDSLFNGDVEQASMAQELMQAFIDDPMTAYRELGELLGLSGAEGGEEVPGGDMLSEAGLETGEAPNQPGDERLSYVEELMQREQAAKEDAEYQAVLDGLGERFNGFDPDLFTNFVLASGGDINAAIGMYAKYHRDPEPGPEAPPVLGGGGTPPPEAPKYSSIDDALDSVIAEDRARRTR